MWFSLLDCGFKASSITNSLTKFTHAVSLLPQDVLPLVAEAISTASSSDTPYEDLKAALLKNLQSSVATRLRELLSKEELGDEKPSQLLSRMKQLLGDKYQTFDADLFKQLFYQRLPSHIQRSLFSVRDTLSLEALSKLADEFLASLPRVQVSHVNSAPPPDDKLAQLTQLVSQLTTEVAQLKKTLHDRSRSRSSSHRRKPRSRSSSAGACWYHRKFGDKAQKCIAPCTHTTSNSKGGQ